jgi:hypothetical protein
MRSLISEVLLPASAAVGLLALLTIPPATAEDRAAQPQASTTMAAVSTPTAAPRRMAPSRAATDRSAETSGPTIEPRCERIERIGKFSITRCE